MAAGAGRCSERNWRIGARGRPRYSRIPEHFYGRRLIDPRPWGQTINGVFGWTWRARESASRKRHCGIKHRQSAADGGLTAVRTSLPGVKRRPNDPSHRVHPAPEWGCIRHGRLGGPVGRLIPPFLRCFHTTVEWKSGLARIKSGFVEDWKVGVSVSGIKRGSGETFPRTRYLRSIVGVELWAGIECICTLLRPLCASAHRGATS